MEVARAMLYDQGLPKFQWGEAANTAVYIQNRCPDSALDSKTLEEVFTGKKPDVSHFRVFGCLVYFHVPKEKRSKLDAYGKKGMFVGYSETSKAYRIYVPGQREVEICHDVTFDEDATLRFTLSLIYAPHASCPCSPRLMGSTSHLANELGNEDRDHNIIDRHIEYCRTLYL